MSKPCAPCAKARKFVPAPLRRKLEQMEQRTQERKAVAETCPHGTTYEECRKGCPPWRVPDEVFTASTLPLIGKDRP